MPPRWPDPAYPQQAHLDLRVPDLEAGSAGAVPPNTAEYMYPHHILPRKESDRSVPDGGHQPRVFFHEPVTDRTSQQSARDDRPVRLPKPIWRGWLHLVWFPLSLIAGTFLIVAARGAPAVTAAGVYAVAVSAMFGSSALYHRVDWRFATKRILQRCDHLMIFVLIAGTATPMYQLAASQRYGRVCLIVTWALAIAAAGLHLARMEAPERVIGGTYIALAAVAALALPLIWIHAGPIAGGLAVAGVLLYVAGALAYHNRRPDPAPSVFGYHEVFHAFVCAAATCHYVAVFIFLT